MNSGELWGSGNDRKGNLETKYCGEVIGDGVQLWTKTGDKDEPNDVQEWH